MKLIKFNLKNFQLLLIVFILLLNFNSAYADDEGEIAAEAYHSYFKSHSVDYYAARTIFGDDYAPVAAYIASKARISPTQVNKIYVKSNKNWNKVMAHFNLNPSSLFLPVPSGYKVGPPYGKAYGYWKKYKANPSSRINLSSNDYINLVNLNIANRYFNTPVTTVMKYRNSGRSCKWIMKNQYQKKYKHKHKHQHKHGNGNGKGKGKGNKKGKNKDND